jgi:hypothetical protein
MPPELVEHLDQLRQALEEGCEPLDTTESGRDMLSLAEAVQKSLCRELVMFARTVGARRFNARVYLYTREQKGKRKQWVLSNVFGAEPSFLPGGASHLRALMRAELEVAGPEAIAIWVHPMPTAENATFFGLFQHADGAEAAFALAGHWRPLGLGPTPLDLILSTMIRPSRGDDAGWSRIVEAQTATMRLALRADVQAYLDKHSGASLEDDAWEEFIAMVYLRSEHLALLQEAARVMGMTRLHESQRLLRAMVDLVKHALENHDNKLVNMEKTHARALKRFKTDLDMYRTGRDVAVTRLKRVEQEVQDLRKRLKASDTGATLRQSPDAVGEALDRFFS